MVYISPGFMQNRFITASQLLAGKFCSGKKKQTTNLNNILKLISH